MADKRTGLTVPAQERRGRKALLREAQEVAADQEALAAAEAAPSVADRTNYEKVTYRISPEAFDAIHDAKATLRGTYRIKVTLEEVAEAALIAIYADLREHQEASILVSQFAGKPERQISEKDGS